MCHAVELLPWGVSVCVVYSLRRRHRMRRVGVLYMFRVVSSMHVLDSLWAEWLVVWAGARWAVEGLVWGSGPDCLDCTLRGSGGQRGHMFPTAPRSRFSPVHSTHNAQGANTRQPLQVH